MKDEVPSNPKQLSGDVKVPLHLVPPTLMVHAAVALREGAFKYGAWNFRDTDVESGTYIGAILRHVGQLLDGEWIDDVPVVHPRTGEVLNAPHKTHLAGIAACCAILLDAYENGYLIDTRPISGSVSQTMTNYELRQEKK